MCVLHNLRVFRARVCDEVPLTLTVPLSVVEKYATDDLIAAVLAKTDLVTNRCNANIELVGLTMKVSLYD
jgi:hypothetical protein